MAVGRNQFTEGMKKDMYAYSLERFPQVPPVYADLFEVVDSTSAYESSTNAIGVGRLDKKPEHEKIIYQNAMEGFTVVGKNETGLGCTWTG